MNRKVSQRYTAGHEIPKHRPNRANFCFPMSILSTYFIMSEIHVVDRYSIYSFLASSTLFLQCTNHYIRISYFSNFKMFDFYFYLVYEIFRNINIVILHKSVCSKSCCLGSDGLVCISNSSLYSSILKFRKQLVRIENHYS